MTENLPTTGNLSRPSSYQKAEAFRTLHRRGDPVILYNIWDAGSAAAVADAGAMALATGSWAVAAAQGYDDGESLPLEHLLWCVRRISQTVALPLSVDFESGHAATADALFANTTALIEAGAIGVNFEDQRIGGEGLYATAEQASRIATLRRAAERAGVPILINARTDVFLKAPAEANPQRLCEEALLRARAYADAGADVLFVPGVSGADVIGRLCAESPLPVAHMIRKGDPDIPTLAAMGIARISFGPAPYRQMIRSLHEQAAALYSAAPIP